MNEANHKLVTIDGEQYLIQHNSPSKAWKTSVKLTKLIAEPFAAMAQGGDDETKALEVLPLAIKGLMANLDGEGSLEIVKEIFSTVSHRGEKSESLLSGNNFDLHFHGKMGHMLRVLGAAAEFQFADFIGAIGDGVAALMDKKKTRKA